MTIAPFTSDNDLSAFARLFFRDRVGSFRKDIAICLTANADRHHAYFPALITCIGFLDLLSGLYAGKLEGHSLGELKLYATRFMNGADYDSLRLEVLYLAFRHKLAHLSFPYLVFDITTKRGYSDKKQRRITWTVQATKRKPPIDLVNYDPPLFMKRSVRPWPVDYNCRAIISVRSFQIDIVKSIYGKTGFLSYLGTDTTGRERFAKCMKDLYPP